MNVLDLKLWILDFAKIMTGLSILYMYSTPCKSKIWSIDSDAHMHPAFASKLSFSPFVVAGTINP